MAVEVRYEGRTVAVAAGDTVLDALERDGAVLPSSCRAGVCQFCMMRAVTGSVPPKAQEGLKDSLKASGHFLACICRPDQPLTCEPAHVAAFRGSVAIQEIREIGPDVALVRFAKPSGFGFAPGQFVTLRRDDGLGRSYSLASRADQDDHFDIHVRRMPNGRMSSWLHKEARPGDRLWAEGPKGDCMYYPGKPAEPLTLVGTGTGMAPLFAITEEALRSGHTGPITIYQGGVAEDRLYLVDELQALTKAHKNVRYVRSVLRGPVSSGAQVGDLKQVVASELTETTVQRIYLCGDPTLVRGLKKELFMAGVSLKRIHADPFVGTEAPPSVPPRPT